MSEQKEDVIIKQSRHNKYNLNWNRDNPEKRKAILTRYYANNIEKVRLHGKEYYYRNKEKVNQRIGERMRAMKRIVIDFYSKGSMQCACCGENEYKFLTIDHISGGGNKHRKSIGSTNSYYGWFIKNNFPTGYQILCWNCNCAKHYYKICPHQEIKILAPLLKETLK